jgi:hypothetical protein
VFKSLNSKIKNLLSDEYSKQRLSENIQTAVVASFWVGFFALMMIYSAKHPSPPDVNNAPKAPTGMADKFN